MLTRITSLFPLWALLFSALAYVSPEIFVGAKPMIVPLLGIVMLGMGITLTWGNFMEVIRRFGKLGSDHRSRCRNRLSGNDDND